MEYCEIVKNIKYSKNILINGSVQSGKTNIILQLAFKSFEEGYDVIILVNNFYMDLKQIEYRLKNFIKEHDKPNVVKILDKSISDKSFINHGIYVSLCNKSRIRNINVHYKPRHDYITIVDESDMFNQNKDMVLLEKTSGVSKNLIKLFEGSKSIVRITATSFSHIYLTDLFELHNSDIYFTENSPNYISFGHEKFKCIPFDNTYIPPPPPLPDGVDEAGAAMANDEGLFQGYNLFISPRLGSWSKMNEDYFIKIIKDDCAYFNSHNIIPFFVVNVTPTIENHYYIKYVVNQEFPDYTVLLVNEGVVKVYYSDGGGGRVEYTTIQEALSTIHQEIESVRNPDPDKLYFSTYDHKALVLVTCKQLGRGISTRSQVPFFNNISDVLYANSIIYGCSDGKSTDEVIQGSLRIGGIFPGFENIDGFELRLHTTEDIIKCIGEQMEWFEETVKRIKEFPDSKVTEVIPGRKEKLMRNAVSKSRGKFIQKFVGDHYEFTEDAVTMSIKAIGTKNPDKFINDPFENLTLFERIKKILYEQKPMTYKEITNKGTQLNAWIGLVVIDGQIERSVSSLLSKSFENGTIKRKLRGQIYEYYL